MLKTVRYNCSGMDIDKNSIVATIGITNKKNNVTEYVQETFSTLNSNLSIQSSVKPVFSRHIAY